MFFGSTRGQRSDNVETVHINQHHHSLLVAHTQRTQATRAVVDFSNRDTMGHHVRCLRDVRVNSNIPVHVGDNH